ncbi:MAG: flagellar filament capping protein FliD [Phycisphaerales bacterium]
MGITSTIGLFSGIDTGSLIGQLLAIDSRPKIFAQNRIAQLQQRQASYLSINSSLLSLNTAAGAFRLNKVFSAANATSSAPDVISATASNGATPGSYTFTVAELVSTQQLMSRGFTDTDTTGLGLTTLSFENAKAGLTSKTNLADLNGGEGVRRGKIVLSDNSGASTTIDLSKAVTIDDVLDAINSQTQVAVTAEADGDAIRLVHSGGQTFTVANAFGSNAATDLGIAGTSSLQLGQQTIQGADLQRISGQTALSILNDGNGVAIRQDVNVTDFTITASDGSVLNIDLGTQTQTVDDEVVTINKDAATIQDVIDRINDAAAAANAGAGIDITAEIAPDGLSLRIIDNTGGPDPTVITDNGTRTAASDLGISGSFAGGVVDGRRLVAGLNSTLASNLNGGAGITGSNLSITDRTGSATGIVLTDAQRSGSVTDLISTINDQLFASGTLVRAKLNDTGTGLSLEDYSGGTGNLVVSGDAAESLRIDTAGTASSTFDGGNLQKKWISRGTLLSTLNNGEGLGTGTFRITDSAGETTTVNVGSSMRTVDDLLQFINSRPGVEIEARVNENGDGIEIVDNAGGGGNLVIDDESGAVAKRLRIEGEFEADGANPPAANGSYQFDFDFESTDTLKDVVDAINLAGAPMIANIVNTGSSSTPFRISFTARQTGAGGGVLIDSAGFDLGLEELSEARDAVVFFGNADPAKAILLTSKNNSLEGVINGVSLQLNQTSTSPTTVTVSPSLEQAETAAQEFVKSFNAVISAIDKADFFNADTEQRGPLLGDQTVRNIRSKLINTIQGRPSGVDSQYQFLFQIGFNLGSGNKLEFDAEEFRAAYENDPQGVEQLIAAYELAPKEPIELSPGVTTPNLEPTQYNRQGVAEIIRSIVDQLTNSVDGTLTNRRNSIDTQIDTQEQRIERIDQQLATKRARYEAQFLAMEQALAQISTQQQALLSLQG